MNGSESGLKINLASFDLTNIKNLVNNSNKKFKVLVD